MRLLAGAQGPSLVTVDALSEVSTRAGLDLRLQRRLVGGVQNGADLVADPAGRLLVVKRQPEPVKAERMLRAAPVIQYATDRGWPAARWLWAGRLAEGTAVVVQEYVSGQPVGELDSRTMTAVVAANQYQAGLAHSDAFDDSAQLSAVLKGHPWREAVAGHSRAGANVVRHGDAVLAAAGWPDLPADDVVHGDYSSSNVILTRRGVAFVDCETVGRGTRVRDLADLYRQCFIYPDAPAAAVDLLRTHAVAIAGPHVFTACVVAVTYNNLAWWVENKTESELDIACRQAGGLFAACEVLCR